MPTWLTILLTVFGGAAGGGTISALIALWKAKPEIQGTRAKTYESLVTSIENLNGEFITTNNELSAVRGRVAALETEQMRLRTVLHRWKRGIEILSEQIKGKNETLLWSPTVEDLKYVETGGFINGGD